MSIFVIIIIVIFLVVFVSFSSKTVKQDPFVFVSGLNNKDTIKSIIDYENQKQLKKYDESVLYGVLTSEDLVYPSIRIMRFNYSKDIFSFQTDTSFNLVSELLKQPRCSVLFTLDFGVDLLLQCTAIHEGTVGTTASYNLKIQNIKVTTKVRNGNDSTLTIYKDISGVVVQTNQKNNTSVSTTLNRKNHIF